MLRLSGIVVLLALFPENGRRPQRIEPYWQGLGKGAEAGATAQGLVALREPLERRVRIPGGRFVMGSTDKEMIHGVDLCEREPKADECRGTFVGPLIHAEGRP